ncbi:MAG: urease accessory protein UreE [Rhodobacter sp.]|nr:urease accessory protein UreE [Rhodobacter sp.]
MTNLPIAHDIHRKGHWPDAADRVTLGYDERFLRRRRLVTAGGMAVLVDLPETTSLDHGDALELSDGRLVAIEAAAEPVLIVTGDLPRIAWHIGNRHTPCQIEGGRLLIRRDHVLEAMLRQLGAGVTEAQEPFIPEGGAYGHGRTLGHDHGDAGDHGHARGRGHVHHHGGHSHPEEPDTVPDPE